MRSRVNDDRAVFAGDSSVVLRLDGQIDPDVNARAIGIAETLQSRQYPGVHDVVPTYRSVAVYFDPLRADLTQLMEALTSLGASVQAEPRSRPVAEVPVCYGGEFGPDLADVASFAGCPESAVIDRHAGLTYRVFMLGFVPGFAYMGTVHPSIRLGRHATPRVRVPAGSVGIAGFQTGIYPMDTPGGWRLIGRTPLKPFDPARPDPFLFAPGDSVRFVAVDRDEYERIAEDQLSRG